jgi:hypothetical protein
VAGDVDHVIHPAGDPVIAILVAAAAVTGEVLAAIGGEIGLEEALMIAPDGAHLPRPALRDHKVALRGASSTVPSASTIWGTTPKIGQLALPGLSGVAPGRA